MKRKRSFVMFLVVLPALVVSGVAVASWLGPFKSVVPPTERYRNINKAIADGYSFRLPDLAGNTCIEQPGKGGMGVHQVNTTLLDGVVDPMKPEVLVYAPQFDDSENGVPKLRLAALEYVVFEADWKGAARPELYGHPFDYSDATNRYGLPAFYALHVWVYQKNPSGIVNAWNPRVSCSPTPDHGEGGD
jgi:hypothetical protein